MVEINSQGARITTENESCVLTKLERLIRELWITWYAGWLKNHSTHRWIR